MTNITLQNSKLCIKIDTFGAEMQSFFDVNRKIECLWQADAKYWNRHAPVLFPIVGRLANDKLFHENSTYPMSQHGFARDNEFKILEQSDFNVKFVLCSNTNTLKQYPFDFELYIHYYLIENCLRTSYSIHNKGNSVLPASIGAHPAFNWPLLPHIEKSKHFILFDQEEPENIRRLENGLLMQNTITTPVNANKLDLKESLFEHDALIFDQLKSRKLTYSANHELAITLEFQDFPHLGLWSKSDAPFICLEPWQGHSSPVNFTGEFSQKPGVLLIPPQATITKTFDIILEEE